MAFAQPAKYVCWTPMKIASNPIGLFTPMQETTLRVFVPQGPDISKHLTLLDEELHLLKEKRLTGHAPGADWRIGISRSDHGQNSKREW